MLLHEKNDQTGGRARTFTDNGFLFDMGPSWYWMPEVFERYYNLFGKTAADFYQLTQLDPGFRVIFGNEDYIDIPHNFDDTCNLFESMEKGAGGKLRRFIKEAGFKYHTGMDRLVYKPANSVMDFMNRQVISGIFRLQVFSSFSRHARKYFSDPRLLSLIEFPVLFLGAKPADTPALYSLMNYACFRLGTWYPMGGFGRITRAFKDIALEQGVEIHTGSPVERFALSGNRIEGFYSANGLAAVDAVIGAADYYHIEKDLLPESLRSYPEKYWGTRVMAPSCLIFYLGVKIKVDRLRHHNLFFDESFGNHADDIYTNPRWPQKPLFYVCCPSKTDPGVAPEGHENIFILMPVASGLNDTQEIRDEYFDLLMERLEKFTGENIREHIVVKRSYCVSDFMRDYNAFKGNAYGLANTLFQTAMFKPKIRSKKVSNLFFAGQLTVPGPGVPPGIISGQISAHEVSAYLDQQL